jgi:nucleoside-diphosphate-sugar epimerase
MASQEDQILVTGSNGFIGVKTVESLLKYGYRKLRCFVRPSSRVERLLKTIGGFNAANDVELVTGDLTSTKDCQKAVDQVSVIYHLAAGFEKSFAGAFMNSALATRNLLDAFVQHGRPRRFVNVSSFAVYSNLGLKRGAILDETCPLENASQERFDAYGFGKLKQEQIVREYGERFGLPYVILRPGYVFGPGKKELSGRVGIDTFGFFIQINGSNLLPLTFVDNCADAIALAGFTDVENETFNIVDDELLTGREFLRAYKRKVNRFRSIRVPYSIGYALCVLWEKYSEWSKGQLPPAFNRRRCAAEWKANQFSNRKARERLGWQPRIPIKQAMELFLAQFQPKVGNQPAETHGNA